jgi:fumarate reductase subunit C
MPFVLHLIIITIGLLLFAFVPWFSPVAPKMLQIIRGSGTVPTRS